MDKEVIVVTGSCGRIGAAVVTRLGDRFSIVGFEMYKSIYCSPNEELVFVDISSDESVNRAFKHIKEAYGNKIASVIHLAAYYSFDEEESPKYDQVTVKGTGRLLRALAAFEVDQFIFSSTMLVHAPCEVGHPIKEDDPLDPRWAYPRSKVKTEKLIHELRGKISTVILRIAGVYDDACDSIPISQQIQRIYENKLESRLYSGNVNHGSSFIHMQDLVDLIEKVVDQRKKLPQELVLLVGEPKTLSYDCLQRMISRLLFNREFKTYEVPKWFAKMGAWILCHIPFFPKPFVKPWMIDLADLHYELDISRAKKVIGWEPKRSLEKVLPKMIEDLKKSPASFYAQNRLKMPKWKK